MSNDLRNILRPRSRGAAFCHSLSRMGSRDIGLLTSDLDIYPSAKLLIDQHGDDAARHAAKRAEALLEPGEVANVRLWL